MHFTCFLKESKKIRNFVKLFITNRFRDMKKLCGDYKYYNILLLMVGKTITMKIKNKFNNELTAT